MANPTHAVSVQAAMPTKKIKEPRDLPTEFCSSRDHTPPSHMVYSPGVYEHTCSGCGKVTQFTVYGWTC